MIKGWVGCLGEIVKAKLQKNQPKAKKTAQKQSFYI
jgi:hypothetical protein